MLIHELSTLNLKNMQKTQWNLKVAWTAAWHFFLFSS